MGNSIGETIALTILALVAVAVVALVMLALPYMIMRDSAANNKKHVLVYAGTLSCAISGTIAWGIGYIILDSYHLVSLWRSYGESMPFDDFRYWASVAVGVSVVVIQSLICWAFAWEITSSIKRQKELCSAVAKYGLDNFGALAGGSSLITKETLAAIQDKGDDELFCQIRDHLDTIGHVIGTHKESSLTMVGEVPIMTENDVDDYGASREDLQTYPQRIAEMYQHW